jgi:hypothetical protein
MQMFGYPVADVTLQIGFATLAADALPGPQTSVQIIALDDPDIRDAFWSTFREVASDPSGRELLYRLLIEIRRVDTASNNVHCYQAGTERVGGLSITVNYGEQTKFAGKGQISFNGNEQDLKEKLLEALEQYYRFLTTLVTFPNDDNNPALRTPGWQCERRTEVNGANSDDDQFTHIRVPGMGLDAAADIYFPVDGSQPTTQQAATWSCADENAGPDSPITKWYMQMFGDPTASGAPLQMGFDQAGNDAAIITLKNVGGAADNVDVTPTTLQNPAGSYFSRAEAFWHTFREVATDPRGRELLYRLLIEIRRINTANGNIHCYRSGTERVCGLFITINHGEQTKFSGKGQISFNGNELNSKQKLLDALKRYYRFLITLVAFPNDHDDPTLQTPGWQCEDCTNVLHANLNDDKFTHIQVPGMGAVSVYFPIDGRQPTT